MEYEIPKIDLSALWKPIGPDTQQSISAVSQQIDKACMQVGFFVLQNYNFSEELLKDLHEVSMKFFHLPEHQKKLIAMKEGGKAWRGWFPLGGQLTSGKPDGKQGIYFGTQDQQNDQRPLHGLNLFPDSFLPTMRPIVLKYISELTKLGHQLMKCLARALKLPENFFRESITEDPTILFRIFHYPPNPQYQFGVQEHTDYGLITLLCIDDCGGLQIKSLNGTWIDAPRPEPGKYLMIVNLGDMLEKLSQGRYRSTPHRVKNNYTKERLSFPLFFDPSWNAKVCKLPSQSSKQGDQENKRWDGIDLSAWQGQYGSYLTAKVSKCFPDLFGNVIKQTY